MIEFTGDEGLFNLRATFQGGVPPQDSDDTACMYATWVDVGAPIVVTPGLISSVGTRTASNHSRFKVGSYMLVLMSTRRNSSGIYPSTGIPLNGLLLSREMTRPKGFITIELKQELEYLWAIRAPFSSNCVPMVRAGCE
ncbi:hypothetical protein AG1IA_06525 [Rhizoctonia solani AG-1 IA]|uniref:Uncharacterized protein n=1 Tax=Thanatephorus cucumeris (strain AG1-IA) TaxID=983506 RepID=L8WRS0_THACA|nr:hypothetical protein AG1IA_06525 [Rhizoctonia solani AG-1 IA]